MQQCRPERQPEADAVGKAAGEHRTDQGTEPEQHPVAAARIDPPAKPTGDEIDQKHHVGHEPGGVQGVFDVERGKRRVAPPG